MIETLPVQSTYLKPLHIFHTFESCSGHLFWSKNKNTELQQKFILFLILTQLPKVPIILTQNKIYNFTIKNSKSFLTTSQADLQYISGIYYRAFSILKYSTYCIFQFPVLNNDHDIEDYFRNDRRFRSHRRFNETLHTANYIVLPVVSQTTSQLTVDVNYYELHSKVILYNIKENIKFLPCTPSIDDCWVNKKLLWKQSKENITLSKQYIWKDVFTQTQSQMITWKTESFTPHNWNLSKLCPFTGKPLSNNTSLQSSDTEKCIKLMIASSINCTSESCQSILQKFYQYAFVENPVNWQSIQHYSPFGSRINGYRYSVFVNKRSIYEDSIALKLFGPLLLCGTSELIICFVTVLCLAVTLKKMEFPVNPFYWIYATVLEQECCKCKWVNYQNWCCLTLWLYSCHLLRMQYASNVCASMTKESGPQEIPNTFQKLLHNTTFMLLSNARSNFRFSTASDLESHDNKIRKHNIRIITNRTIWYFNNSTNILTLAYSGPKNEERFSCKKLGALFFTGKEKANKYYDTDRYKRKQSFWQMCTKWNRFALFYNTNPEIYTDYKFQTTMYSKLLLLVFGDYILIENSDPVIFPELHQWFSRKRTYLSEAFDRKIGSLTESGLHAYQNHILEIFTQRAALLYFLEGSQFNQSWNWFTMINQVVSKNTPLAWYSAGSRRLVASFTEMHQNKGFGLRLEIFIFFFVSYAVAMIFIVWIFLFEVSCCKCFSSFKEALQFAV